MKHLDLSALFWAGFLICFAQESFSNTDVNSANQALLYLSRFGYVDPSATNSKNGALLSADAVKKAIIAFQNFAGLNQTGEIDKETKELMNTPRCGVKDRVGYGTNARRKRYALQGSRWKVKDLTYKITKYPKGVKISLVDRDISKAFKVWSDITELTFTEVTSGKVHIEIRFEKGEHGDGDSFDGPGGTLAHAYFPIYGGDAHFDDTETWTFDSFRGTNLFQVAAHEFGHSLGLSHSDVRSALMAPFYRGYQSTFELDDDDISAIQTLYGKKTPEEKPVTRPPKPVFPGSSGSTPPKGGDDAILCKNSEFDTITTMMDKQTYVFKGTNYWKLTDEGIAAGYPKRITKEFAGLPSHLDATFTWTNGKSYFFKGSKYYRFTDFTLDDNYPKKISDGFAGIPNDVDAAFVWSGNGKIYFFKDTNYYKFDPTKSPPVEDQYPKDISLWEGLPYYIDGAMKYSNGYTYFFKNGKYYRFDDRAFKVDVNHENPFPRLIGPWWFGCSDKRSQQMEETAAVESHNPVIGNENVHKDDSLISDDSYDYYYDDDTGHISPRVAMSKSYDSGATSPSLSSFSSWLVLPVLLKYICL